MGKVEQYGLLSQSEGTPKMTYKEINIFLANEEKRLQEKHLPERAITTATVTSYPLTPKNVIRAGSFRSEFPEGGDPRFRKILAEMLALHIKKGADYGTSTDIFANVRGSEELGIDAWRGTLVRCMDKVKRLCNAAKGAKMANESVQDSWIDLANYAVIGHIMYDEWVAKQAPQSSGCGEQCGCSKG